MRVGEVVGERFEIERVAGSGGMGTVYRARDGRTGGPVAVKVMSHGDAQSIARFRREAEVLFGLQHPRIVRYVAHGATDDGEPYLVTEWLDGEELERRLARGALTVAESITVARGVAEALAATHRRGVVHRDIKPSNIFLVDGAIEGVKILDYGIAHLGAHAAAASTLTRTGMMLGTLGYMSPEQARGERQIEAQSDVFSLGCVLFKCLTGQAPFTGGAVLAVLLKVVFEEAPRASAHAQGVPDALDDLVARMLSKASSSRPADGEAVLRAITSIEPGQADSTPRPSRPESWLTNAERRVMCVVLAQLHDGAALESTRIPARSRGGTEIIPPAPETSDLASTVVLGGDADTERMPARPEEATGTSIESTLIQRAALEEAVAPHGGKVAILVDGTLLINVTDIGTFTDQVSGAGRSALALRAALPQATIVLVAGRGEVHARLPIGEVIERGVALLRYERASAEDKESAEAADPPRDEGGALEPPPEGVTAAPQPVRIDEVIAGLLATSFELGGDGDSLYLLRERDVEATRTLLGRPTPCVGRERELATIRSIFDEVVSEPAARAIRVIGPAGIGKSRLRQEFLSELRARGVALELWMGRGDPMRAGSPFGVLAPALRRAAGILEGEPLLVRRRKLRARVGRHISGEHLGRVVEFIGELIGTPFPPEQSLLLRTAHEDAVLMGDQMRRAFEDFVAAESEAQPVVIVMEDLEWGDLPSLQFIDGALRSLPDRPLLVLAVARPEIEVHFANMWAGRPVTDLKLGGLTRRGSERLVREMLGDSVDTTIMDRIHTLAEGNAFYLEELIRAVAEGKGTELPESVLAMVQARLAGLTPEERRALRAASVFGHAFWPGGVLALLGENRPADLRSILGILVDRELILRRPETKFPHQQELVFRHALVREAAYEMLTPADRALGHRLAGAWLERAGESDAAVLAEHFERSGQPRRAVAAYRRAAEQALSGNDLTASLAWADRGLACAEAAPASTASLGALRLIKAETHRWKGEYALADACAAEALEGLPPGSHEWFSAAGEVAMTSGRLGKNDRLDAIGREILDRWSDQADSAQTVAAARAATILLLAGGYALADALIDKIKRIQARETDPNVRSRIHQVLARRALVDGDPGEYIRHTAAAAECCEQVGDIRRTCIVQGNLGFAQMEVGAYDSAERALREALTAAERLDLPNLIANTKQNLGFALAHRGALDEALRVETEALRVASSQSDHRLVGSSRSYIATILHLRGALDEAEREATSAVEVLAIAPPVRAYALATLAKIRLAMGKHAEALRDATEARGALDALGGTEVGDALIRLVHAEALDASGDRGAAAQTIEAAATRLLARAEKLDAALRESFLTRVPENARTLELARRWRLSSSG